MSRHFASISPLETQRLIGRGEKKARSRDAAGQSYLEEDLAGSTIANNTRDVSRLLPRGLSVERRARPIYRGSRIYLGEAIETIVVRVVRDATRRINARIVRILRAHSVFAARFIARL